MTEPKYRDNDFEQLTKDEQAMIIGIVAKNICVSEISRITGKPEVITGFWSRDRIVEEINKMTPREIEVMLILIRKIDD